MTDPDDDLRRRRAALDAKLGPDAPSEAPEGHNAARSDLARGLKLSSEFIAGVLVGALIGYLFDIVLGTSPFGLIVFLLLGFAAGVLNVMRETGAMARPETRVGPHAAPPPPAPHDGGHGSAREDGPGAGDPAMYDDD